MNQPTNQAMYFRPSLPHYATAQMTIINPVPLMRHCPNSPWVETALTTTTANHQNFYKPPTKPILPEIQGQAIQLSPQPRQTWQSYDSSHSEKIPNDLPPVIAAANYPSNLNQIAITRSPKAPEVTDPSAKVTATAAAAAAASVRPRENSSKKNESEKSAAESLQETVYRQRELIGKLISVIVKDRLKTQDGLNDLGLKDDEVSEVEKLINFSDSLKSSKHSLKSDKNSASNFSSGDRKRRTITVTGERKQCIKRQRRERKASNQLLTVPQTNTSHNPNSLIATLPQLKSNDSKSSNVKDRQDVISTDPDHQDEIVAAMSKKVIELMNPNGDSRLLSLRLEFARQLKSLEEEFERECGSKKDEKPETVSSRNQTTNEMEVAEDSDWLPSSVASSSASNKRSRSLTSDTTSESLCLGKKKIPKRKHARCYKPNKRNKHRPFRPKPKNSSSIKPTITRHASGMAMEKIDRLLKYPETDDASSNGERPKKFHERALEKLRQSMALWNKMSSEMNSYFLGPTSKTNIEQSKTDNAVEPLLKEQQRKQQSLDCKPQIAESQKKVEDDLAALPSNKTDPTFMLSKFLQFLPDHSDEKQYLSDGEHVAPSEVDVVNENNNMITNNKCVTNCKQVQDNECDLKNLTDIVKDLDATYNDNDAVRSSSQNAPFYYALNQPDVSDPDIIGEVIIVTTDENNLTPADSSKCVVKEEEVLEESFISKCEISLSGLTDANLVSNGKLTPDPYSEDFLDKLHEEREALSPTSIALRLRQHEKSILQSEADYLPPVDFSKNKYSEVTPSRMQMFQALNTAKDESIPRPLSPPSNICITKVVSLNNDHPCPKKKKHSIKSKRKDKLKPKKKSEIRFRGLANIHEEKKKTMDNKIKEKNFQKETPETQISTSFETDASLARPLKNLISDIKLGKKSDDTGIIEWGLVPRKAMHLAKQRIQKQLCGGEKDEEIPRDNRRSSLRSNLYMSTGGESADGDYKKLEKKKIVRKKHLLGGNNSIKKRLNSEFALIKNQENNENIFSELESGEEIVNSSSHQMTKSSLKL